MGAAAIKNAVVTELSSRFLVPFPGGAHRAKSGNALLFAKIISVFLELSLKKQRISRAKSPALGWLRISSSISMKMAARDEDAAGMPRLRRAAPYLKGSRGIRFQKSITVDRPVRQVYLFWRHLENLPRFMRLVQSVTSSGGNISHWIVKTANTRLEWDAETIEARPNKVLSWRSLPAAKVESTGSIQCRPARANRGTVVTVTLKYAVTGGKGAQIFGKGAEAVMEEDLLRFKSLIETGEVHPMAGAPSQKSSYHK